MWNTVQFKFNLTSDGFLIVFIDWVFFHLKWKFIIYLDYVLKIWCTVVMSMFVSSKWQRVVLPTRWSASVRTLFYCYLTFLDHRTNISRKVRAPRRVIASGEPNKIQNCHLDTTNMEKYHNTGIRIFLKIQYLYLYLRTNQKYQIFSKNVQKRLICWEKKQNKA